MEPIQILLVFLGGTMILIVGGTWVSLYLFTEHALETNSNHVVVEKPGVERPVYYRAARIEDTSANYARGGLMVIAGILLLTVIAVVSIFSGILH